MVKDELSDEIQHVMQAQTERTYTDAEAEKIRQRAAKIFDRYESEMADRMSKQVKDYLNERYLYS